jgi:hypothetical protein
MNITGKESICWRTQNYKREKLVRKALFLAYVQKHKALNNCKKLSLDIFWEANSANYKSRELFFIVIQGCCSIRGKGDCQRKKQISSSS